MRSRVNGTKECDAALKLHQWLGVRMVSESL